MRKALVKNLGMLFYIPRDTLLHIALAWRTTAQPLLKTRSWNNVIGTPP